MFSFEVITLQTRLEISNHKTVRKQTNQPEQMLEDVFNKKLAVFSMDLVTFLVQISAVPSCLKRHLLRTTNPFFNQAISFPSLLKCCCSISSCATMWQHIKQSNQNNGRSNAPHTPLTQMQSGFEFQLWYIEVFSWPHFIAYYQLLK